MKAAAETERDWLRSVREARGDLIHVPVMPVRPETLPADEDCAYLCSGCGLVPDELDVYLDADGWIWCLRCASSDEVGAVLTRDEAGELRRVLVSSAATAPMPLASEAWELAGQLGAALSEWAGPVPNPFGLAC